MIFYYSATGITRKFAQKVAERIDESSYDIEELLEKSEFEFTLKNEERLGFFAPVYFGDVPEIMKRFIAHVKIHTGEKYYCYIGLTYGGDSFAAPNRMVAELLQRGLTTTAVFGLKGIDTFIPFYKIPEGEERQQTDARTELESAFIAEQVSDRSDGTHLKRAPFPHLTTFFCIPLYKLMRKTANFVVSDACTGCGLCARHCPEKAIEMDESTKHPKWIKPGCMLCFRCLHHCPAEAIDYGKQTVGKVRLKTF